MVFCSGEDKTGRGVPASALYFVCEFWPIKTLDDVNHEESGAVIITSLGILVGRRAAVFYSGNTRLVAPSPLLHCSSNTCSSSTGSILQPREAAKSEGSPYNPAKLGESIFSQLTRRFSPHERGYQNPVVPRWSLCQKVHCHA